MLTLKKLDKKEQLKPGMDLLTVDHAGNESLDHVEVIDNGKIYTTEYSDNHTGHAREDLDTFLDEYRDVFEVTK